MQAQQQFLDYFEQKSQRLSEKSREWSNNNNGKIFDNLVAQIEQKGLKLLPKAERLQVQESTYRRTPSPDLLLQLSEGREKFEAKQKTLRREIGAQKHRQQIYKALLNDKPKNKLNQLNIELALAKFTNKQQDLERDLRNVKKEKEEWVDQETRKIEEHQRHKKERTERMHRMEQERRKKSLEPLVQSTHSIPLYRVMAHDYEIKQMKQKIKDSECLRQIKEHHLQHSPTHRSHLHKRRAHTHADDGREDYHEQIRRQMQLQARKEAVRELEFKRKQEVVRVDPLKKQEVSIRKDKLENPFKYSYLQQQGFTPNEIYKKMQKFEVNDHLKSVKEELKASRVEKSLNSDKKTTMRKRRQLKTDPSQRYNGDNMGQQSEGSSLDLQLAQRRRLGPSSSQKIEPIGLNRLQKREDRMAHNYFDMIKTKLALAKCELDQLDHHH